MLSLAPMTFYLFTARPCAAPAFCLLFASSFFLSIQSSHAASQPTPLASQTVRYSLDLAQSAGGGTTDASGSMTYSVQRTCSAWETVQKLDIQSITREHGPEHMQADYTTSESLDGRHLTFRTQETVNGRILQNVSGQAQLNSDGSGAVTYARPLAKKLPLPAGTMFPMAHTRALVSAALASQNELSAPLFDGTLPDGAQDSYATLMGWTATPAPNAPPALRTLPAGHIHVAYYDRNGQNMTPTYVIGMHSYANGVVDKLDLDFGDFRMNGTLNSLELPAEPTCAPATSH
ncbi:DUF1849 family protein [Acetobacter suratthaniensis]|uniref:DUF1849 family protein n=1 Tax=Acetobacter suratthaniensis TaxID=1502841 RepID=A0ABS3LPK2_9PROT|nr:DUF1849 family protein [Acetobacter suratthaniensis]MBO1329305.1 DUF1849 family protein [Acetobacter suratthaniensis]MCX2566215.1 DUF1849 family protein [Acetobacter suratthaniensis]